APPAPRCALLPYTTLSRSMVGWALSVVLVLAQFDFNLSELLGSAAANSGKEGFLDPGLKYGEDTTSKLNFVSLGLALVLGTAGRSEEHTSELQSRENLVCR